MNDLLDVAPEDQPLPVTGTLAELEAAEIYEQSRREKPPVDALGNTCYRCGRLVRDHPRGYDPLCP